MKPHERQSICVRTVILLKCLQEAGYFDKKSLTMEEGLSLSAEELYIAELLFHFQTGIQYNLHAVYQVRGRIQTTWSEFWAILTPPLCRTFYNQPWRSYRK